MVRLLLIIVTALLCGCAGPVSAAPMHRMGPAPMHLLRLSSSPVHDTALSLNWSGYAILGRVRSVHGTFTVPSCQGTGQVSEWVGVDGYNNQDLIQAGVDEIGGLGYCDVEAWWEILPAASTPIAWFQVSVGDVVSVGIRRDAPASQFEGAQWEVSIFDHTTGRFFTQDFRYNGPATSGEWVVEAPTIFGNIPDVLPFTPVTWTNLGLDGHAGILSDVWLVQDGMLRALPSSVHSARQLMEGGFTSTYVGD